MLLIIEFLFIILLSMMLFTLYRNEISRAKSLLPRARLQGFWDGKERRQNRRFKETLEVTYVVKKRPRDAMKIGKTANISESGLNLILDEKLAKGAILNLQVSIPGLPQKTNAGPTKKEAAEIEGEVVWSEDAQEKDESGKRLFYCGIRFLTIRESSKSNLMNYLNSLS